MRNIGTVLLLLVVVLLLGCGSNQSAQDDQNEENKEYLEGRYVVTSLEEEGKFYNRSELEQMYKGLAPVFSDYFYIQFFMDGTFISPMMNGEGGTYYIIGDEIFAEDAEEKYIGTVEKNRVILSDDTGMEFTFDAVVEGEVT